MASHNAQYVQIEVLEVPRSSWATRGDCATNSTPFLAGGENVAAMKAVCAPCKVQELCLAYAIANDEPYGVWGGMTLRERRAHRSKMDVSRVPLEFRDHYLKVEGRVKRSHPTPRYIRNPNLDLVIDPDFLLFIEAM